jgi:transposase
MKKPRTLFRYPWTFKRAAVDIASLPGVRLADVARALDLHPKMLSLWRCQFRDGVPDARSESASSPSSGNSRSLRRKARRRALETQRLNEAERRLHAARSSFSREPDHARF